MTSMNNGQVKGLRCIKAEHEKWGDIESDEEDHKYMEEKKDLNKVSIMDIMGIDIDELVCEEVVDMRDYEEDDEKDEQYENTYKSGPVIYDDVTGKELIKEHVDKARRNEVEELKRLEVFDVTDLMECCRIDHPPNTDQCPMDRHEQRRHDQDKLQISVRRP